MKKLVFVVLLVAASAQNVDMDFRVKLSRFHQHYDKFLRKFMGCGPMPEKEQAVKDGVHFVECDADLSMIDQKEFKAAREEAKVLFDLEDKK